MFTFGKVDLSLVAFAHLVCQQLMQRLAGVSINPSIMIEIETFGPAKWRGEPNLKIWRLPIDHECAQATTELHCQNAIAERYVRFVVY